MKKAIGKYSQEAKSLLKGKISQFSYTSEVQAVLAERRQKRFADSYIRYVVYLLSDQDMIWDAIVEVLARRKQAKAQTEALTAQIKELVEVD